jgi:nucleotide-binding universal stress UspA family protein
MTDRILIPLDGSRLSERILGPLGPFLQKKKAEVTLLRVVAPRISKEEEAEVMAQAAEQLGSVAAGLEKQDIDVTQRLERGDPAEQILEVAHELHPDLLAMSTHGRTGVKRIFRGSVAERVLRKCPVPLFLCNPHAIERDATGARFRRILVPLDGSPRADARL